MTKMTIPVLLAATIVVAGMFAFMPVNQASTVHTTIQQNTMDLIRITDTCTIATDNAADCDNLRVTVPTGVEFVLLSMSCTANDESSTGTNSADLGVLTVDGIVTSLNPTLCDFAGAANVFTDLGTYGSIGSGANTITSTIAEGSGDDQEVLDTIDFDIVMLIASDRSTDPTVSASGT